MADIYCAYGLDIAVDLASGDLVVAVGWDEIQQFLERVLLTCPAITLPNGQYVPADYFAEPTFGLGLPRLIGASPTRQQLETAQNLALQAVYANPDIQRIPAPQVTIANPAPFTYTVVINCTPVGQQPGILTIPLNN